MKRCSKCKIEKDLSEYKEFFRKDRQKYYLYAYCNNCRNIATNEWRKKNPERTNKNHRRARIKRNYGITETQYDEMCAEQKNRCAICNKIETYTRLVIDHDHKTNLVRKLLCHNCNKVLGLVKEDPMVLNKMIEYLRG